MQELSETEGGQIYMGFAKNLSEALAGKSSVIGQKIERTEEMDRQILIQDLMNRGITEFEGRPVRSMNKSELIRLQGK